MTKPITISVNVSPVVVAQVGRAVRLAAFFFGSYEVSSWLHGAARTGTGAALLAALEVAYRVLVPTPVSSVPEPTVVPLPVSSPPAA